MPEHVVEDPGQETATNLHKILETTSIKQLSTRQTSSMMSCVTDV